MLQDCFKGFLDEVCSYIGWKEARREVRYEMQSHLEERAECYEAEGLTCQEAAVMAVGDMGSCEEIGMALDKQHQPRTEWRLIGLTAGLTLFGTVLMIAAQSNGFGGNPYFQRYISGIVLGIVAVVCLMRFQYHRLLKYSMKLFVAMLIFEQVYIMVYRLAVKTGYHSTFGQSAFCEKYFCFMLIPLAGILYQYRNGGWKEIFKWMGLCSLVVLVGLQYPAISGLMFFIICGAVLLLTAVWRKNFSGKRSAYFTGIAAVGMILSAGCLWIMKHFLQEERFHSFFMSGSGIDVYDRAAQWRMAAPLFGSSPAMGEGTYSGVWGVDEFALTGIIATLGWAAGIVLLFITALFLIRLFRTVAGVRDGYGACLAMTCSIILGAKFVINILINFGMFPAYAISMPLVSRGSVDFLQNMILIGFILSVWRRSSFSEISSAE